MRLILSRKGFDSGSGGCPSPIFPDGSMLSLPIPDPTSPVRYEELSWRGHNLGELVERLKGSKARAHDRAHVDPDLRRGLLPREPGWRPLFGQCNSAQGHLRNSGVRAGDVFLFWGLFREVDAQLRWRGKRRHVIWGWMQIGEVASVDDYVRPGLERAWKWAASHAHLAHDPNPSNTLYVASDRLALDGLARGPGAGVFERYEPRLQLTAANRPSSHWSLPKWFGPNGRKPLSYHGAPERWSGVQESVFLKAVSRGQEFVLDTEEYPEATSWLAEMISGGPRRIRTKQSTSFA